MRIKAVRSGAYRTAAGNPQFADDDIRAEARNIWYSIAQGLEGATTILSGWYGRPLGQCFFHITHREHIAGAAARLVLRFLPARDAAPLHP